MDWASWRLEWTLLMWRFARWLYRGQRQNAVARVLNRGVAAVFSRGVSLPLVMVVVDRERYLVSNLGPDVAWVRNVKATAGRAVLRHGRTEPVRLEELAIETRAPVLKAYLQCAPGARPHIPVAKDAPLEEFEAIASRFPVFRVHRDRC